jgi:hypothetical protein
MRSFEYQVLELAVNSSFRESVALFKCCIGYTYAERTIIATFNACRTRTADCSWTGFKMLINFYGIQLKTLFKAN